MTILQISSLFILLYFTDLITAMSNLTPLDDKIIIHREKIEQVFPKGGEIQASLKLNLTPILQTTGNLVGQKRKDFYVRNHNHFNMLLYGLLDNYLESMPYTARLNNSSDE